MSDSDGASAQDSWMSQTLGLNPTDYSGADAEANAWAAGDAGDGAANASGVNVSGDGGGEGGGAGHDGGAAGGDNDWNEEDEDGDEEEADDNAPGYGPVNAGLHNQGYQAGYSGGMGVCPANADADGSASYDKGYLAGQKARAAEDQGKMGGAGQSEPVEERTITVLSDDGVGPTQKTVRGTKAELDRMEAEENKKYNQQQWDNWTGLGDNPGGDAKPPGMR